jgi:signal transduction histidine kinase
LLVAGWQERVWGQTLSDRFASWFSVQRTIILDQVLERASGLLPESEGINSFLSLVQETVGLKASTQLRKIQSWIVKNIGSDQQLALDWVTLLRVSKEVIWDRLPIDFGPAGGQEWRDVDRFYTRALIEVARLAGSSEQGEMLRYMADLRQQTDGLEKSKNSFISVAAHELRTPLTILEGYANMLRVEIPADMERVNLLLDGFENGTRRLREIINDMVDVVMIDMQSLSISYQLFSVEKVIRMAASNLETAFTDRNVTLVMDDAGDPTRIYGDANRLLQAFTKVLVNGLKYTPDGGQVTVRRELVRQSETSHDIKGYVDVIISDTGIGIDAEDVESIFGKFVVGTDIALHSSGKTKFKGGGPGLGLPIARGIIEAHGGRIWVESPGANEQTYPGSTFHIELPIRVNKPEIE